jgi:hypothetical protein
MLHTDRLGAVDRKPNMSVRAAMASSRRTSAIWAVRVILLFSFLLGTRKIFFANGNCHSIAINKFVVQEFTKIGLSHKFSVREMHIHEFL